MGSSRRNKVLLGHGRSFKVKSVRSEASDDGFIT